MIHQRGTRMPESRGRFAPDEPATCEAWRLIADDKLKNGAIAPQDLVIAADLQPGGFELPGRAP